MKIVIVDIPLLHAFFRPLVTHLVIFSARSKCFTIEFSLKKSVVTENSAAFKPVLKTVSHPVGMFSGINT